MMADMALATPNSERRPTQSDERVTVLHVGNTARIAKDVIDKLAKSGIVDVSYGPVLSFDRWPNGSPKIECVAAERLKNRHVVLIMPLSTASDLGFASMAISGMENTGIKSLNVVITCNMMATDDRVDYWGHTATAKHSLVALSDALARSRCTCTRIFVCEPHTKQLLCYSSPSAIEIDLMSDLIRAVIGRVPGARGTAKGRAIDVPSDAPCNAPYSYVGLPWLFRQLMSKHSARETADSFNVPCIVLPDNGAAKRYDPVLKDLSDEGYRISKLVFNKSRLTGAVKVDTYDTSDVNIAEVERFVVIDDIVRSGGTLISTCELLRSYYPSIPVDIAVAHADFVGGSKDRLVSAVSSGVIRRVYITDSNPGALRCIDSWQHSLSTFCVVPIGHTIAHAVMKHIVN
jgi:hypothetical protein